MKLIKGLFIGQEVALPVVDNQQPMDFGISSIPTVTPVVAPPSAALPSSSGSTVTRPPGLTHPDQSLQEIRSTLASLSQVMRETQESQRALAARVDDSATAARAAASTSASALERLQVRASSEIPNARLANWSHLQPREDFTYVNPRSGDVLTDMGNLQRAQGTPPASSVYVPFHPEVARNLQYMANELREGFQHYVNVDAEEIK